MHAAGFELIPVGHKNYKTVYKTTPFGMSQPVLLCLASWTPPTEISVQHWLAVISLAKKIYTQACTNSRPMPQKAKRLQKFRKTRVSNPGAKRSQLELSKRSTETMRQYWIKWAFKWQPIRASQIPQTLIRTEYAHKYLEMKCREEAYSLTSFQPQYEWKEIGCQQGVVPSIKTCQTFREMKKWSRRRQRRQRFTDGTIPLSVLSLSHTIQSWEFLSEEFIGVQ